MVDIKHLCRILFPAKMTLLAIMHASIMNNLGGFIMKVDNMKMHYVDIIIIFALMFGFGFLPPISTITPYGMRILGIFLGCIYAWTRGSQIWPSLLGLLALSFMPGNTVNGVFSSAFGNGSALLVLFTMLFCAAIESCGLLRVISDFVLSRKFAKKSPWLLAAAFFIATIIGSMLCGNFPTMIVLYSVLWDVTARLGLPEKHPYTALVMVGIVIFGYLGNSCLPYCMFLQMSVSFMNAINPGYQIDLLRYSFFALVITIVALPTVTAAFKLICPKFEFKLEGDIVNATDVKLTKTQKIVLCTVAAVVLILFVPSFLTAGTPIHAFLSNFGITGAMCAGAVFLMIFPDGDKNTIADIGHALKNNVSWEIMFLLYAALTLASFMTGENTGIVPFITSIFTPLLAGKSPVIFVAIVTVIGCVLTNILNNAVVLSLMIPVTIPFAVAYSINPSLLVAIYTIIIYQGVVMPSGSAMGAFIHGCSEQINSSQIYKYATLGEIILVLCLLVIGIPLGMFLF